MPDDTDTLFNQTVFGSDGTFQAATLFLSLKNLILLYWPIGALDFLNFKHAGKGYP